MKKPDGSPHGPQHHHYTLHLAHHWLCEHTCQRHEPSLLRAMRGEGPHAHKNPNFHANLKELDTFPPPARSKEIAEELRQELFATSDLLPAHMYSTIWHQYQQAADALASSN